MRVLGRLQRKRAIRRYLWALDELQQTLFACYLEAREDGVRLAHAHDFLFAALRTLRRYWNQEELSAWERLYEAVLLLGQLRFRITDRTLFAVCQQELSDTSKALSALLQQAGRADMTKALAAYDQIKMNFQGMYENVLRVTAKDPLVWQFFLMHLDAVSKEITALLRRDGFDSAA